MHTKQVQVVMLSKQNPINCLGLIKCIKEWKSFITPEKDFSKVGDIHWGKNVSAGVFDYWQPQHLYFISNDPNEKIKEGDIAVYNGELYHINTHHKGITYKGKNATSGGGRTEYNYYTVLNMSKGTSSTEIIHYPYSRRFKPVVACSDPTLGLPAIPLTWIRYVYVPSNGSIKEVRLETDIITNTRNHFEKYQVEFFKVTPDNEVVIVDEPKGTFEETHTIYTHPEENAGRLDEISKLLDKLKNILDKK